MKYLTPQESEQYVQMLEQDGFDLKHWEHLEMLATTPEPLRDNGFDLLDFRQTINQTNKHFNI